HALYAGGLPLWAPEVRKRLEPFDVALVAGTSLWRSYIYHEPSRALPESLKRVQLDEDPWQLGKTYPVDVGLVGDTKAGLAELQQFLTNALSPRQLEAAKARRDQHGRHQQAARAELT